MDHLPRLSTSTRELISYGARLTKRDWASAIVIRQAADATSASEQRAKDAEARRNAFAHRLVEEVRIVNRQIHAAEMAKTSAAAAERDAEMQTREAEARRREAEVWLAPLHDEIVERLITPGQRPPLAAPLERAQSDTDTERRSIAA